MRIDDRGAVRSGTQTTQLHGSTWYAPDIGIVRSVVWTDATRTASQSDDRLLGFDGVGRGFGFVPTSAASTLSTRALLGSGYVALNNTETTVLDRNGRLVASGSIVRAPEEPYAARLLPTSDGLRVASLARSSTTSIFNLDTLDSNARLMGDRLGTLPVQSGDSFIQATPDFVSLVSHRASPVIWMSYVESISQGNGSFSKLLVVQRFDASGRPLGTQPRVRVLDLGNDGTVRVDRAYALSTGDVPRVRVVIVGSSRWLAWQGGDGWTISGSDFAPLTDNGSTQASVHAVLALFEPSAGDGAPSRSRC